MTPNTEAIQDAAWAAQDAAEALTMLSVKLKAIGTEEARRHASEASGAAKIARGWAWELFEQHRVITKAKP